jgi:hypothetical protein
MEINEEMRPIYNGCLDAVVALCALDPTPDSPYGRLLKGLFRALAEFEEAIWPKGQDEIKKGQDEIKRRATMINETYLGDSLYASFDGWQITLRAPRGIGDHFVALDPHVLEAFECYVASIRAMEDLDATPHKDQQHPKDQQHDQP